MRAFRCHLDGLEFATEGELAGHVQAAHGSTVDCVICGAEFASEEQLDIHAAQAHKIAA